MVSTEEINYLEEEIDSFIDTLNLVRWGQYFNMIAEIAFGLRDHHKAISAEILRMIAHTNKGEMNRLIPVSQLTQNLNDINAQMPKGSQLPIDILKNESTYNIFKVSQVKSALIDDRIIIEIKIPILNVAGYTLPIPFQRDNKTFLIMTDHELFLTDSSRTSFIPMTNEEYENCMVSKSNDLIFTHSAPKYSILFRSCEIDMLRYTRTYQYQ